MPPEPRAVSSNTIRGALRFYQICSVVTGVLLLLLCAEMLVKYGLGYELEFGGLEGILAFVPNGTITAVNISTGILVVHGWFFVVYLISDMRLWSLMRWPIDRFLLIALGGVIPLLSFFVETRMARVVREYVSKRDATPAASGQAGPDAQPVPYTNETPSEATKPLVKPL